MPYFTYKAKNEHGDAIKGKVEARNERQAASALRSRQLLVIELKRRDDTIFAQLNKQLMGVGENDIVNLTRQLSTMITAGLSLTEALHILQQQAKPAVSALIDDLLKEVEGGNTFASALEQHQKQFPRVYTQLVRAGETAGVLDEMLSRLAENLEKSKEFRGKTKGALIYPAIVVVALIAVAAIMMIFVIPKLTEMYQDFGADLPLATQVLIDISNVFVNFWWLMLAVLVASGIALRSWLRTATGQRMFSRFMLKIPLFGELRKKIILTEFARTLSLLLTAGISLLQAVQIASDAIPSLVYREELEGAAKRVEKGVAFAQSIQNDELFPPILIQMASVGEETGKLDEVLMKLATYFQTESEQAIKNLTTAIEPMIMIVLGFGVALMVIAIIMPIYNLTSQF